MPRPDKSLPGFTLSNSQSLRNSKSIGQLYAVCALPPFDAAAQAREDDAVPGEELLSKVAFDD